MSEYYKDGYFWRKKSPPRDGAEDLIFNTCTKIVNDRDFSDWAQNSLNYCAALLLNKRRWPKSMDIEGQAPNKWAWWLNRITHKYRHRAPDDVTRDLYIALYAVAVMHNMYFTIEWAPIPWWLNYVPAICRWRRNLLKTNRGVVNERLDYYMSLADVFDFENKHSDWIEDN
jgi:hypothetical protein